jgi:hypothetical protein
MNILPVTTDSQWQIVKSTKNKANVSYFIPASGSVPIKLHEHDNIKQVKKRKIHNVEDCEISVSKKTCLSHKPDKHVPVGLIWDSDNYSCAYDTLFTILYDIWLSNPIAWGKVFKNINVHMCKLSDCYKDVSEGKYALENARDQIRYDFNKIDGNTFPYGQIGTDIFELANIMMHSRCAISNMNTHCDKCKHNVTSNRCCDFVMHINNNEHSTVDKWFTSWQDGIGSLCNKCNLAQKYNMRYNEPPKLLIFKLSTHQVNISKTVKVQCVNNKACLKRGSIFWQLSLYLQISN